ncbi:hypothetical protein MVES_002663 [Malassezia vespertilionis]|uniref:ATPase expression protein 2, mitochondrial n=1 Tax=Malassezia vespertilionis TaxID=2020962 RepID=A0A2N1JAJ2_9BASI|nr:hypothetical protein MVES_002663 [Malassezia vespertilionis]
MRWVRSLWARPVSRWQVRACSSVPVLQSPHAHRNQKLAGLHGAMARGDPGMVYDAFLAADDAPLGASDDTMPQLMVLLEHAKRTQRRYAAAASPNDRLVSQELAALLSSAYFWNASLSAARTHRRTLSTALGDVLDLFLAGQRTARLLAAQHTHTFPDTVSYNIVLHAIVRSIPTGPGAARHARQRAPPTIEAVRKDLAATPHSAQRAVQYFDTVWRELCATCAPSHRSWSTRMLLYARMRRADKMRACMQAMVQARQCSTASVNLAMQMHARLYRDMAQLDGVYEAMRYNHLQLEMGHGRGRAAPRTAHVEAVLGVPYVPDDIVPDRGTFLLLIRHHANSGDLDRALQVLHDMLVTPWDTAHGMAPSLEVYHAMFTAFARFGASGGAWHVHTLGELFDGYLRVAPFSASAAHAAAPGPRQLCTVLQALWATSRDPAWVAAQWRRLVQKFAHEAWHGFRVDARVDRKLAVCSAAA